MSPHNEAGRRYAAGYENRAKDIARHFCTLLRAEIGDELANTAASLNAADENPNACHSHDFVDANEVMSKAMQMVIGKQWWPENEQLPDDMAALFNEAWNLAKAAGFVAEKVK